MPDIEFLDWHGSEPTQSLIKVLKDRVTDIDSQWHNNMGDGMTPLAQLAGMKQAYLDIINSIEEVAKSDSK